MLINIRKKTAPRISHEIEFRRNPQPITSKREFRCRNENPNPKSKPPVPGNSSHWRPPERSGAGWTRRRWRPRCGKRSSPWPGPAAASPRWIRASRSSSSSTSSTRWRKRATRFRCRRSGCHCGRWRTSWAGAMGMGSGSETRFRWWRSLCRRRRRAGGSPGSCRSGPPLSRARRFG